MALNFGITGVAGYVAPRHLGPSWVLTNVTTPRAEVNRRALFEATLLRRGCTVGANATIVCGVVVGRLPGGRARRAPLHRSRGRRAASRRAWRWTSRDRGDAVSAREASGRVPVSMLDLKAQHRAIRREIDEAIARVLDSGKFILGPVVDELEHAIAALCGCHYAIGVSSVALPVHPALGAGEVERVVGELWEAVK